MTYLPTVDLWDTATGNAVRSGQIKLQVGQWVRCGSDQLSRFVKVTDSGSVWVVHPKGILGIKTQEFSRTVKQWTQPRLTSTGGAK